MSVPMPTDHASGGWPPLPRSDAVSASRSEDVQEEAGG
jgi:hypothetical protein